MVEFLFSNSDYISVKVILQIKVIYIAIEDQESKIKVIDSKRGCYSSGRSIQLACQPDLQIFLKR